MNQDFRVALAPGSQVRDPNGKTYLIVSEIGRGGSSIVYDVCATDNQPRHYALKEIFPISEGIERIAGSDRLSFGSESVGENVAQKYAEREQRILSGPGYLPPNTSEDGQYFVYKEAGFNANGTHYVLIDTEKCQTLAESHVRNDLLKLLGVLTDVCKGLAVLHRNGCYHLDLSSRNILIFNDGRAKITDFGTTITKSELDSGALSHLDFAFTPAFSSMEVKRAAHGGMIRNINASCDTYSVCALLFRYTVGRSFNPTEDLTNGIWEKELRKLYSDTYTPAFVQKLIGIIRRGLSGQNYRYHDAGELAAEIEKLTVKAKKDAQKRKNTIFGGIVVLCCILSIALIVGSNCFSIYMSISRPEIVEISGLQSVYFDGDTITLDIVIADQYGINTDSENYRSQILDEITPIGFTVAVGDKHISTSPYQNPGFITYHLVFSNISITEDGEKGIRIGQIYFTDVSGFKKHNEIATCTFSGYTEGPKVFISEPTFTKVNSETGHSVTYTIRFESPQNENATIDLSHVYRNGFSCSNVKREQTGANTFELTFLEITGTVGECWFEVYEGACKLESGAYSQQTRSPSFDIVEDKIPNSPMYMYLHMVSQDLRDGGYILLQHGTYSGQEYVSLLNESMVHFSGFTADVSFEHNAYILLDNLILEENVDPLIWIDAGAYVSKENGSRSAKVHCELHDSAQDNTPPTAAMMQLGNDSRTVATGTDLILMVVGSDETSCYLNQITDIVETSGFSYDDYQVSVSGLTIRIIFTNVKPSGNNKKGSVILKAGTYSDLSGNHSYTVKYVFEIIP